MIFIHIVSVYSLVILHATFAIFAMSKSYFNIIISSQQEIIMESDKSSYPILLGPLMKKIPSSVISAANNDIKQSSTKTAFYKCTHKYGISMHTTWESWLGIWNLCQKTMGFGISYRQCQIPCHALDVSVYILCQVHVQLLRSLITSLLCSIRTSTI